MAWRTHHSWRATAAQRKRRGPNDNLDRVALERDGWQTTLEYRENHHRDQDGVLGSLKIQWRAEAESTLPSGDVVVLAAVASSPRSAWRKLRRASSEARHSTANSPASRDVSYSE